MSLEAKITSPSTQRLIEDHVMQISKLHLEMAKAHSASFVLLPGSTELVREYWKLICRFGNDLNGQTTKMSLRNFDPEDEDDEDPPMLEKFSLKGLLIIRACVKIVFSPLQTYKYQHAEDKEEQKASTRCVTFLFMFSQAFKPIAKRNTMRFPL